VIGEREGEGGDRREGEEKKTNGRRGRSWESLTLLNMRDY